MTAATRQRMSFKDYVALEERSQDKHGLDGGEIFAMAGGTPEHAAVVSAVHAAVARQLHDGCRAFVENLRVRTPSGAATYPDVFVVCGPLQRDPEDPNTATNPVVIIEVLSESTEAYDRGRKFTHYRSCPSLVEYVLLASRGTPRIERFVKTDSRWSIADDALLGGAQQLTSVDITLDVDAIYRGLLDEGGEVRAL